MDCAASSGREIKGNSGIVKEMLSGSYLTTVVLLFKPTNAGLRAQDHVPTVLLIDDEVASLTVVGHIMEHDGFNVVSTTTPDEAVRYCRFLKVDLLIADIILASATSGIDVALLIREHCPDVPVLLISGTPVDGWSENDLGNIAELLPGRIDFLAKPFTARTLVALVSKLMANTYSGSNIPPLIRAIR